MLKKYRFVALALSGFLAVCALVVVLEVQMNLTSDRHGGYNIHHFLYGLGVPLLLTALFGVGVAERPLGKGREYIYGRVAIGLPLLCSVGNELVVYWLRNPAHGADWDHFASDCLGLAIAWLLLKPLCERAAAAAPLIAENR